MNERELIKELAGDLEAYINHHYAKTLNYPVMQRKYEGEMKIVIDARRFLEGN